MRNTLGKILLVEDDEEVADLYKMRLEAEGFEVKHCNNGETALQEANNFKPQLVLLDIMMPTVDGYDVLDILRNTPVTKNAKIVILSALSEATDRQRALDLGADSYLVKSQVLISDVMAKVRELLNLPAKPAPENVG